MFRNRKNSQKPSNELYAAFKQNFPHVGPGTTTTPSSAVSSENPAALTTTSIDQVMDQRHFGDNDSNKDHDTGLGESDHWRFTPSMLDTNSYAFTAFANQHSEGFTPNLGVNISGVNHSQAGDLHTPGIGFGLGTPLSITNSEGHTNATSTIDMHGFHQHLVQSQTFQNVNSFAPPQTFAPSSFMHHNSGYENIPSAPSGLSNAQMTQVQESHDFAEYSAGSFENVSLQTLQSIDKFRYQVTLNAPTAMVKHSEEIPITYLNKGQAYVVTISDSMGLGPAQGHIKYRTVVRISFEDEQQRQRPSACWQLWKEGRGLAEAHQRSGRLQAVEYVDPNQGADEDSKRPHVELERASFDSFSVTWSPASGSANAACSVAVRFNFLSTDFSHSKGVKGIPVRLCAKTEIISSGTPDSPPGSTSEVCFCKVKLFRDHGAERKLSNDVAHIKKTIDKLKQQIAQAESGVKEVGKRKRSSADKNGSGSHRPGKIQKHRRAWSVSSQGSNNRPAVEEDLHMKLETMQDMFTSTRPVSVLYLKGYEQDDPDIFPVSLPGEPTDLTKTGQLDRKSSWDHKTLSESTPTNSCAVSPSPSSRSNETSNNQKSTPPKTHQHLAPDEWQELTHLSSESHLDPQDASVKVRRANVDNSLSEWIEAFDVDPCYKAPPMGSTRPIACFYVLINNPGTASGENYYRAIYLMERTVKDLVTNVATKCGVNPSQVVRILRINSRGLKIVVDDEVVRELPEGQDLVVQFLEVDTPGNLKEEPGSGGSTPKARTVFPLSVNTTALEMRLLF